MTEENKKISYEWRLKEIEDLTIRELYAILQLRQEVFVVEQKSIYNDLDDKDLQSSHLMCWNKDELIACARIVGFFSEMLIFI